MVKHDWEVFFKNRNMPDLENRAKQLSKKIFMATEWLHDHTDLKKLLEESGKKFDELVTYHDPCHAKKVQGIWEQPRDLISKNYPMVEMSNPDKCCGFGGVTMQSEKFDLAKRAGAPKAAMIKDTKAKIVSAECSACRVQISESLNSAGVETIFKNPLELIAEALR
jgi:glycolate oxidase iron-sulfur subunit